MKKENTEKIIWIETLSDTMNLLDNDLVEHTEARRRENMYHKITTKNTKHAKGVVWQKRCAAAACLCMLCAAGAALSLFLPRVPRNAPDGQGNVGSLTEHLRQTPSPEIPENTESAKQPATTAAPEPQPFVAIAALFPEKSEDSVNIAETLILKAVSVPVGNYSGQYDWEASAQSDVLSQSLGDAVSGTEGWYYVSGHTDMQYLIFEEEDSYSLWKFHHFLGEDYPYSDVLRLVYQIDSADQITELVVAPAKMDNTDAGRKIQEQIGTHTITDRDTIEAFYQIISSMICRGSSRWDLIHYGDVDAAADTDLSSHAAVLLGRYLSFVTDYGNTVDGLKYTAVSDMFYEFEGVAYDPLTAEQAKKMRDILNIAD